MGFEVHLMGREKPPLQRFSVGREDHGALLYKLGSEVLAQTLESGSEAMSKSGI